MEKGRAALIVDEYLSRVKRDTPQLPPGTWQGKPVVDIRALPWGDWTIFFGDPRSSGGGNFDAVIVRSDTATAFAVYGAIGNLYFGEDTLRRLGPVVSEEGSLGSGPGRYQMFERGIIIWEASRDFAYDLPLGYGYQRGARCPVVAACADLRGFTNWSRE